MPAITQEAPKRHHRYAFWLILGALSTYFAEVVTASTPFPFFTPSGILVTYPFYTLNVLVFSHIAFRKRKVDLYTLFLAGQVFGLFEAYGTKMLWSPGWGSEPKFLGIALVPFLLLVFLWHPIMSFTLPLMIAETYLTASEEVLRGLPNWLSRHMRDKKNVYPLLVLFVLFCSINQAVNSPSRLVSLVSLASSWGLIIIAASLWRRAAPNMALRELLPTKRELLFILPLFVLIYVLLGLYLFPQGIPALKEQVGVWLLYALFGTLLYLDIKSPISENSLPPLRIPWKGFTLLGFATAVVASLLPKSVPLVVIAWTPCVVFGLTVFLGAVFRIIKGHGKTSKEG